MDDGVAEKFVTAAGAGLTVTVAVPLPLPPTPVHCKVYEYTVGESPGAVSVPVLTAVPEVGSVPLQEPDAVHVSALALDHVIEAEAPAVTMLGVTSTFTSTAGA